MRLETEKSYRCSTPWLFQDIRRDGLRDERRGRVAVDEAAGADHAEEHPRYEDAGGDVVRSGADLTSTTVLPRRRHISLGRQGGAGRGKRPR